MLSVAQARKILGKEAMDMPDERVRELLLQLYELAEMVIELKAKNGSK